MAKTFGIQKKFFKELSTEELRKTRPKHKSAMEKQYEGQRENRRGLQRRSKRTNSGKEKIAQANNVKKNGAEETKPQQENIARAGKS